MFSVKIILLSCALLILCSDSVYSGGFYYDNGFDQTVIDHQMTNQDKYEVEHEILNLLGLPTRPKRKSMDPLHKSAPKFLLDVYKSLMEEENGRYKRTADSELNLTGEEQHAIDESDIIMTFENQNQKVSNVRHERGKRLWFNVSEIPLEDTIIGAELRIYKNSNRSNAKSNSSYVVTIYQLINADGERELEYVQSFNTTGDFESWLEFNLTSALSTWVSFPESNKGLYLSVHAADKPAKEIRPEDIGLVSTKGNDEKQPFMVAFMKTTNQVRIRSASTRMKREARMKKSDYNPSHTFRNIYNDPASHGSSRSCKIQTLYIHFKDLKWQDWIIAPEGYAAYYCSGECKFPLNAHMNATNHAIVQTLVHLMTPTQVPKPCCAPTRLTPISVLYFSDDSNVVLKKYKKMSVKSCGCH